MCHAVAVVGTISPSSGLAEIGVTLPDGVAWISGYGVEIRSWQDAFNGVDHDEDPREKGLIPSDGWHQSSVGVAIQADVLHVLGYDPIVP